MNVIMIYWGDLNVISGTPLYIKKLVSLYLSQGCNIHLFCKNSSPIEGVTISEVNAFKEIKNILGKKNKSFEFIFGHTITSSITCLRLQKQLGIPSIVDLHCVYKEIIKQHMGRASLKKKVHMYLASLKYSFIEKIILPQINTLSVVSTTLQEYYSSCNHKIIVNYPPLSDYPHLEPITLSGSGLKVLYVGNLRKYQGRELLLKCASKFVGRKDITFYVVGEHTSYIVDTEKYSNVKFMGLVSHKESLRYISSADVLLIPRIDTPITRYAYPSKLTEYLSLKKPIIMTDVADARHFIRDNGYLIGPSADELAQAIEKFLKLGEEGLKKMGEQSGLIAREKLDPIKNYQRVIRSLGVSNEKKK